MPEVALLKIKHWCAYQERSQNEARLKLLGYGLDAETAEAMIAQLISDNFLNEERFATAFAGGKFRIKKWGKNKIRTELRQHKVSDPNIRKALESIDKDDYESTLKVLIEKRIELTGTDTKAVLSARNHAVSKGFESDLVMCILSKYLNNYES